MTDPTQSDSTGRQAAAQLLREQIDKIYQSDPPNQPATETTAPSSQPEADDRPAHDPNALRYANQNDLWRHYHSAWQSYYQQYYHRYYLNQLHQQRRRLVGRGALAAAPAISLERDVQNQDNPSLGIITGEQATKQVHDEIVRKVKQRAKTLRRSHHFMPIATALAVGLLFLFVQYNRLLFAQVKTYVSPGSASAQSIILDPTVNTKVGPEPRMIIPKINVDAPVVYGVKSLKESDVQLALRDGIVHYPYPGADSLPGQVGNSVFLGHTSNDVFDPGKYKFVFVLMERLQVGDTIYVNYQGTRYTYLVNKKEVVNPNEINKLVVKTNKPLITLVGCVPVGTANQRLLIFAEQVSPDPAGAKPAPVEPPASSQPTTIPGNSPTFLERLFGGGR
ncbi:MAG: class E sortase [Candidatus Chaera renei]|uniref:Class E sortase n=1 Tax=Candidatus Chaera renei TaxID=2506947 RepID=A0A4Q0AIM8_9BACT|nr:MAG: class E sortase [Candidatus Chaera renei]